MIDDDVPFDPHEEPPDPTTLYRLYDAGSALLYVGIARVWPSRMGQHRAEKPWWGSVASVRLETFRSRAAAERAERDAIRSEKPAHNVVHNGVGRDRRAPSAAPSMVLESESIDVAPRSFDHSHLAHLEEYARLQQSLSDFLNAANRRGDTYDDEREGSEVADIVDLVRTSYAGDCCKHCGVRSINWPFAADVSGRRLRGRYHCSSCGRTWTCSYTTNSAMLP